MKKITRIALLLVPAMLHTPANANEAYRWIGQITEDGAALSFGIPNSDAIKLDFHCERKTRNLIVNYEHEPAEAKDGIRLAIRFSLRGRDQALSVKIPATGRRSELDDKFMFQAETRMSPQLRRILSDGGSLLVTVAGKTEEIPLNNVALEARRLFASCP